MLSWSEQLDDTAERIAIQTEFEEKFNHQARGLADLQEQKEILREKAIIHQTTKSLFDEKTHQLKMLQQSIQNDFDRLIGHTLSAAEWETALSDLSSNLEKMRSRALELKLKLEHLQIDPKYYLMEDPGNQFDPQIVEELHQQKDQLESDLGINRSTLENLKARACERTGDEITAPWPDVYTNLKTLLSQRRRERQGLLAEIIAGIGLTAVLTQLREEEDQKIVQALQDKEVTRTLHNITGYQYQMDLKKGLIVRQGRISSFALEDLSTGAREQALLALRLGFAARICEGDPLFLLLDDAFQHSDWERREGLVQSTINLASNGWQIIYLSMDDHIRNLYQEKAGPIFKDQFKYFELP